ncbi:hypothetical protein SFRURICE_020463 [Spodoptera frugiperda]|nr:hypothetical protein SFRURICE_020463 [Spodoptera frugiperda]
MENAVIMVERGKRDSYTSASLAEWLQVAPGRGSRLRFPDRAKYYWAFFGFSSPECARYMAIGSPPITWDLQHKFTSLLYVERKRNESAFDTLIGRREWTNQSERRTHSRFDLVITNLYEALCTDYS